MGKWYSPKPLSPLSLQVGDEKEQVKEDQKDTDQTKQVNPKCRWMACQDNKEAV